MAKRKAKAAKGEETATAAAADGIRFAFDAAAERAKVVACLKPQTPGLVVDQILAQMAAAAEARVRIEHDGMMVRDGKNNPMAHPCLEVERTAQRQVAELMRPWVKR